VNVGTGYGRTLAISSGCEAENYYSVSPLKKLQVVQVEMARSWGSRALATNEDMPDVDAL
jgi:hypothetical protein